MELQCNKDVSNKIISTKYQDSFIVISSNWDTDNNKCFNDCISTLLLAQASDRINLEDVVSLNTCVALKSNSQESCKLEFKLINKQKIARIALVSEASVLEFFKQSGEYATTIFAEFVDEFQDHSVYFAETIIQPPSTEVTIKFTRTNTKGTAMWIYGIKLILTESILEISKSTFDLDVINNFLINVNQQNKKIEIAKKVLEYLNLNENNSTDEDINTYFQKIATMRWSSQWFKVMNKNDIINQENDENKIENGVCNINSSSQEYFDLKTYIDNKFINLERKLIERVELMDKTTSHKLDTILKYMELNFKKQ